VPAVCVFPSVLNRDHAVDVVTTRELDYVGHDDGLG
jgi:hypothetical protein